MPGTGAPPVSGKFGGASRDTSLLATVILHCVNAVGLRCCAAAIPRHTPVLPAEEGRVREN